MPSAAELKRAEDAHSGSAKLLLDAYLSSLAKYEERFDKTLASRIEYQRPVQLYR